MSALTAEQFDRAHAEWGASCGPGVVAGVLGIPLEEVRKHLNDYRGFMNPTQMRAVLRGLGIAHEFKRCGKDNTRTCPRFGLVRIQLLGPWSEPGVPAQAAYHHTHWIGGRHKGRFGSAEIFDVNALDRGGWLPAQTWCDEIAPQLVALNPRRNGCWRTTHTIELSGAPA